MSKDHFYFNRNDRIVALILLCLIVIVNIICNPWVSPAQKSTVETDSLSYIPDTVRRIVYIRDTVRRNWYVKDTVVKKKQIKVDSLKTSRYAAKQEPESPLDLNVVDSTELVRLPGIGPAYASKILRYREQLGGYLSLSQLTEINGLSDTLMKWFIIGDTIPMRMVKVNSGTIAELRRHPYINFYQARVIVEYRRERGNIKGPEQLSFMEEFTERDLDRLLPYLDFK